jgi:chromatin remodeling complex protein RSC6
MAKSTATKKDKTKKSVKKVKKEGKVKKETKVKKEEVEVAPPVETPRSTRRVVTRETVAETGTQLIDFINAEVEGVRAGEKGAGGVRFLKSVVKQVKAYNADVARVTKQKQKNKRVQNTNSGFLKPVKISSDMCDFTGWDESELKSRVEVTKFICDYIKENDLQKPEDRRVILADKKLSKLLNYDSKKDGDLRYFDVQRYLKPHFIKEQ